MYNKLGNYQDDERGQYNFTYTDNEGKHVSVSFRAEKDYDLDIIFNEFRNFLIATNHDIEGHIGELHYDDEEESLVEPPFNYNEYDGPIAHKDKFSMDHLPNNGWPFGDLTTASIPSLTTADIAPLTVTDLNTNQTYSYKDRYSYPTMSPLTTEQIQALSINSYGFDSIKASQK